MPKSNKSYFYHIDPDDHTGSPPEIEIWFSETSNRWWWRLPKGVFIADDLGFPASGCWGPWNTKEECLDVARQLLRGREIEFYGNTGN